MDIPDQGPGPYSPLAPGDTDQQLTQEANKMGQKRRRCNFYPAEKDGKQGEPAAATGNTRARSSHVEFSAAAVNTVSGL